MCHARSAWWLETKSYAPRRTPSRRSVHSTEHKECARFRSRSVAPPSPPHNVLFGVVVRAGFSKGETDGVLNANSVDSVLRNYFLGHGFAKTETDVFEIRRGFGLGFSIVSVISLLGVCPSLKGVHPRHPPRAFPLRLRA